MKPAVVPTRNPQCLLSAELTLVLARSLSVTFGAVRVAFAGGGRHFGLI